MKFLLLMFCFLFFGCNTSKKNSELENWKSEIRVVEKSFNDMAQHDGLVKAFEHYAAESAVIVRGKEIIKGKSSIGGYYKKNINPNESLSWSPTFVDVSESGDMAYTYGNFTFTYIDSLGIEKESKGVFHTVWKRQENGSWKFVYD